MVLPSLVQHFRKLSLQVLTGHESRAGEAKAGMLRSEGPKGPSVLTRPRRGRADKRRRSRSVLQSTTPFVEAMPLVLGETAARSARAIALTPDSTLWWAFSP